MSETKQTINNKKKIVISIAVIIALIAIIFGVLALCGVFDKKQPEENTVKITITIEVNGGTGTFNDITVELDENKTYTFADEEKAAITDALNREGYKFKGLSTTPDGEGGWTITIDEDTPSPVTLYAIWEAETYGISYDMHGHGTAPEKVTGVTALPAELPAVEDLNSWRFEGWYLDGDYETPAVAGATIGADTTLHAKWEVIIFTRSGSAITGLTDYGKTLSAISIPTTLDGEQITGIGSYAFNNCTGLTSVTIPEGITSMGSYAFSGCTGLESITIPKKLTSIGQRAFHGCTGLESITILEGLTSIDYYAFRGCTSLKSIEIPVSLTSISYYVFDDCTSLETVYYKGDSTDWNSINIDYHNTDLTSATRYYYSEAPEVNADGTDLKDNYWHYVGGVPTIWTYADRVFTYSGNTVTGLTEYGLTLTTITIPSTIAGEQITSIGNQAFNGNETITSVTIQNGVTSIGASAFVFCYGLTSVTIPNSVESIESGAFAYCENLTTVTLPDGIMNLPYMSFAYCTSLESVIIPRSVTNIEYSAFGMIDSLITVYFKDTSAKWDEIEIGVGNTALTNGTVYYYSEDKPMVGGKFWHYVGDVPTVWEFAIFTHEGGAITGLTDYGLSLTEITIPDTLDGEQITSIADYAFNACNDLASVIIPNSVTSIGDGAFAYTALTSITIPENVTSIGECTFEGCTSLQSIIIPEGVTFIGECAFNQCTNLTAVYYKGTGAEWSGIEIQFGNTKLTDETVYYYSEDVPTEEGNYWHDVGGEPVIW